VTQSLQGLQDRQATPLGERRDALRVTLPQSEDDFMPADDTEQPQECPLLNPECHDIHLPPCRA
jgi:hypothetical protein